MSTLSQNEYIRDLAIKKLKEFKEFKELLTSLGITVGEGNMAALINGLTDKQASDVITELIKRPEPKRQRRYADKRIKQASDLLDEINRDIAEWDFELR